MPLAAALAILGAVASPVASGRLASCGTREFSYAGFSGAERSYGISARLTPLSAPGVRDGHVAAWVGVGGPGLGPGGTDEWLQVGLSGFADEGTTSTLYYELALPGQSPQYFEIRSGILPGEAHRATVLEMHNHPMYWRVWVDNHAVTKPIFLPHSHRRWAPIATAESWNAGAGVCNAFSYRFGRVVAADAPGGAWHRFERGYRFEDPGYRVVTDSRSSFLALGESK